MAEAAKKILVNLFIGFDGAGKKTLMKHIVKEKTDEKIAVISSEGNFNGAALQRRSVAKLDPKKCSSCGSLRKDLRVALEKTKQHDSSITRVLIEIKEAEFGPVFGIFNAEKSISSDYQLDSVIAVVDAERFHEQLHLFYESASQQIACADIILINKTDLITDRQEKSLQSHIFSMKPHANIFCRQLDKNAPPVEHILSAGDFYGKPASDMLTRAYVTGFEVKFSFQVEIAEENFKFKTCEESMKSGIKKLFPVGTPIRSLSLSYSQNKLDVSLGFATEKDADSAISSITKQEEDNFKSVAKKKVLKKIKGTISNFTFPEKNPFVGARFRSGQMVYYKEEQHIVLDSNDDGEYVIMNAESDDFTKVMMMKGKEQDKKMNEMKREVAEKDLKVLLQQELEANWIEKNWKKAEKAERGEPFNVIVVGEVGQGKSSLIQALTDPDSRQYSHVGNAAKGVTKDIEAFRMRPEIVPYGFIHDTPGVGDQDVSLQKLMILLQRICSEKVIHCIILCQRVDQSRIGTGLQIAGKMIKGAFKESYDHVIVCGTFKDKVLLGKDKDEEEYHLNEWKEKTAAKIIQDFLGDDKEAQKKLCTVSVDMKRMPWNRDQFWSVPSASEDLEELKKSLRNIHSLPKEQWRTTFNANFQIEEVLADTLQMKGVQILTPEAQNKLRELMVALDDHAKATRKNNEADLNYVKSCFEKACVQMKNDDIGDAEAMEIFTTAMKKYISQDNMGLSTEQFNSMLETIKTTKAIQSKPKVKLSMTSEDYEKHRIYLELDDPVVWGSFAEFMKNCSEKYPLYRYGGVLFAKGKEEKIVFRGMYRYFEGQLGEKWGAQERKSVIFISGKDIKDHEKDIEDGLKNCIAKDKLRYKVGDEVDARVGGIFERGRIVSNKWDEGNAYLIELDADRSKHWAPKDTDRFVKKATGKRRPTQRGASGEGAESSRQPGQGEGCILQ